MEWKFGLNATEKKNRQRGQTATEADTTLSSHIADALHKEKKFRKFIEYEESMV